MIIMIVSLRIAPALRLQGRYSKGPGETAMGRRETDMRQATHRDSVMSCGDLSGIGGDCQIRAAIDKLAHRL